MMRRKLLFWMALNSYIESIVSGVAPLSLPRAKNKPVKQLTAFGGTEQRNLPDNYIERQFIYMMDGSYLQTDIVPTYDCKVEMDFATTSLIAGGAYFLGGRTETYGGILLAKGSNGWFLVDAFGNLSGDRYTSSVSPTVNTRYKFTFNNKVATLESGGSVLFTNTSTGENANGAALCINGLNASGTPTGGQVGIYLYSFKAWDNQGNLIADYVPAVQKGTVPVVGFYDTVSKTFKTATAGTFAAGGEAVPTPDAPMDIVCNNGVLKARHQSGLPLGYTLLDYIESSGTQYIDTGVHLLFGDEFFFDYMKVASYSTENKGYGAGTSLSKNISGGGRREAAQKVAMYAFSNNAFYAPVLTWGDALSKRYTEYWKIDTSTGRLNATLTDIVSGTTYTTQSVQTSSSYDSDNNLYLFRDSSTQYAYPSAMRLYRTWLKRTGGNYAFDFVPAKNSSNVVGMYDLVSGQFFTNAGTGDFVAGDPVSDPVEIYTDGTVETINVHGKNLYDANSNKAFVEENTQYTVSLIKAAARVNIAAYDTNDTLLGVVATWSSAQTGAQQTTFTTPENTKYIACATGLDVVSNVQIEQGSAATDYVPYYNGGTATAETLLKIGNYTDQQEIIDGTVTRNVGIKVLNGTEYWNSTPYGNTYSANVLSNKPSGNVRGACSHYPWVSRYVDLETSNYGYLTPSTANLAIKNKDCVDVTAFKTWLADQYAAGTPVIVLYPLATPTTESVAGQTLQVTAGDNTLEITQASLTGLELEAEYMKTN